MDGLTSEGALDGEARCCCCCWWSEPLPTTLPLMNFLAVSENEDCFLLIVILDITENIEEAIDDAVADADAVSVAEDAVVDVDAVVAEDEINDGGVGGGGKPLFEEPFTFDRAVGEGGTPLSIPMASKSSTNASSLSTLVSIFSPEHAAKNDVVASGTTLLPEVSCRCRSEICS